MKLFLTLSLIVTIIFYIAGSVYSAQFNPFKWIDRGIITGFWVLGILVSGGGVLLSIVEKMIKEDEKNKNQ